MNSHKLDSHNHSHIIGRQDGVTGDSIKANDTIVFCAACQSVFLKESWEYMNGKHCNQSETLDFVPAPVPNLIAKKKNAKLIFKTFSTFRNKIEIFFSIIWVLASSGFWNFYFFRIIKLIPNPHFPHLITFLLALAAYLLGAFGLMLSIFLIGQNKLFRKVTGLDKKTLRILENGIELRRDKIYSFYEMQKLHYSKTKKENKLTIYLKNGEIIQHKLPKDEYQKTKDLLFGLVWVAQFVQTTIYVENQKEHGIAKSIERNYVAKFLVVEDKYVLDVYH